MIISKIFWLVICELKLETYKYKTSYNNNILHYLQNTLYIGIFYISEIYKLQNLSGLTTGHRLIMMC